VVKIELKGEDVERVGIVAVIVACIFWSTGSSNSPNSIVKFPKLAFAIGDGASLTVSACGLNEDLEIALLFNC